ncbi:hypothetical protein DFH08DRAFT_804389 [Mycena albidolilacea]|uniref:Uncharacterized protein n=1 Tax=Mycena albidolilacea TaxID=1033008 RepID=A0AAD7AC11_9AGAR|nr:hypothetical protein DFH08DRAFT_804389 [Mycena albidolilacea]
MAFRANRSLTLTNIRVLMVSAFRLAWRSPIVLCPPENICSAATADPGGREIWKSALRYLDQECKENCVPAGTNEETATAVPPLKWVPPPSSRAHWPMWVAWAGYPFTAYTRGSADAHIPHVPASSLTLGLGCNHAVPGSRQCFIHAYIDVGYPYTAYNRGSADELCYLSGLPYRILVATWYYQKMCLTADMQFDLQAQDLLLQSAQSLLFWSAQLILVPEHSQRCLGIPSHKWECPCHASGMGEFPAITGNAHVMPQEWGNSQPSLGMPIPRLSGGGIPRHHQECPRHASATGEFPGTTGNAHVTPQRWGNSQSTHNGHYYHIWKCRGPSHFLDGNGHSYQTWKA